MLRITIRCGVEDTRLEAKAKVTKNPKPRTDFLRTDPLEAKDRNTQGQEPTTQCANVLKKKSGGGLRAKIVIFPRNFRRSPKKKASRRKSKIIREISVEEKKGHYLGQFLKNKKMGLSPA